MQEIQKAINGIAADRSSATLQELCQSLSLVRAGLDVRSRTPKLITIRNGLAVPAIDLRPRRFGVHRLSRRHALRQQRLRAAREAYQPLRHHLHASTIHCHTRSSVRHKVIQHASQLQATMGCAHL